MKLNYIKDVHSKQVFLMDQDGIFTMQPNLPKDQLALFNYWDECKRSQVSDKATCSKLVLDYDDGMTRREAEEKFKDFHYIIYNSASNTSEENRFRIILFLKEPISALQLKLIRKTSKFKEYFDGVDFGTFAIGRFFKIPSKYDKDGNQVVVTEHVGNAFDFYSLFPKVAYSAAFEALKEEMYRKQMDRHRYKQPQIQKYREWFSKTFPNGVHYMDLCSCATRAKSLNISYSDAVSLFERNYVGNSDWKKNYQNFWKKN